MPFVVGAEKRRDAGVQSRRNYRSQLVRRYGAHREGKNEQSYELEFCGSTQISPPFLTLGSHPTFSPSPSTRGTVSQKMIVKIGGKTTRQCTFCSRLELNVKDI